jgi:glycosyltransferase involved in cell wall biosynthesis
MSRAEALAGRRVVVVSQRDTGHPHAGEAEYYLHQIALRWVAWGARVTWLCTGTAASAPNALVDGIEVRRVRGLGGIYRWLAGGRFDALVDALGETAPPLSALLGRRAPVVRVAHRIPVAGRRLAARGDATTVALSPSAGHELRRRHRVQGPIVVVPPGADPVPGQAGRRAADPTVVVVAPFHAEQRLDVLLDVLGSVAERVPGLRVEIVGDGPEPPRVARGTVTVHSGRVADDALRRAWVTASAAETGVHGCAVLEAAARGVPCVGLDVVGIRDLVRSGRTGWLAESTGELGDTLVTALTRLADAGHATWVARQCQAWAGVFRWERSARLMASVVAGQLGAERFRLRGRGQRRQARPDIATVATFPAGVVADPAASLRATDEVGVADGTVSLLLRGCDEVDAAGVVERLGVPEARLRLAGQEDLLVGPRDLPAVLVEQPEPGQETPV